MIIGNIGQNPEVRHTQTGKTVANFSVATNEIWKDQNGERQQKSEWHRIVTWNKNAEFAEKYLKSGLSVYIEGKLQTRSWDDNETGQKRYQTEILAYSIQFLEKKKQDQGSQQPYNPQQQNDHFNYPNGNQDDQTPF